MKPTIIIDNKIPFINGVLDHLAHVKYLDGADIDNNSVQNADALIVRTRTKCDEKLLKNSSVKYIATATIGFDHIDTAYCRKHGIQWANAPGCNAGSVKQYMASALFYLQQQSDIKLTDCTIGIVGVGNVGKLVAEFCRAVGMKVLLNDPPRQRNEKTDIFVSLAEIAEKSDIITFHTPLIKQSEDKTFHLADDSFFSSLKRKPVIINTARGKICDTLALKTALANRLISAVVLDCWENEPHIDVDLLHSCVISTPHIAGYSADGKANATTASVQYISKCLQLGMDNWYVKELPQPANKQLIETNETTPEKILTDVILKAYNIHSESQALKNNVADFEFQRNHYTVRREFPFYKVLLKEKGAGMSRILQNIGFNVVQ